jgi:aryl-alcohol dehydrogenase-like predicted oxidoreductase
MRMTPDRMDERSASDLLLGLIDGGVNVVHVSSEYDSFPLFAQVFRAVRAQRSGADISVIAKVAVPHFEDDAFDPGAFEAKVDAYLHALAIERLAVVQWLLRHDLAREDRRLAIYDRDAEVIGATIDRLQAAGKIASVVAFPYTRGIAERVLEAPWCDGLALYVNPLERQLDDLIDAAAKVGKHVLAIRPFAAGRALRPDELDGDDAQAFKEVQERWPDADPVERALRYALANPAVSTAVASVDTPAHAAAALAAARKAALAA